AALDHAVCADVPRLTQVFWNLLKNAFKFTPDGGSIRVRTRDEAGGIAVEIADTGIGIGADLLPRIFDSFEQGERSITRRFGGLGLGLAISKALVELHKGRIEVASGGAGEGATFTVWLPRLDPQSAVAACPDAAEQEGGPPETRPARPLRILLVEDHMDTAAALADLLDLMGHQAVVAHDVASGLSAAETALAGAGLDLVISDLGLPDGSGHHLMRELSARHGVRGIALSGYGTEKDVRASREAGFALHLTKPVDLERLRAALRAVQEAFQD
ncbi:MAG: ATP-binding protein, partial [Acidobacteriota bacterium]